MAPHSWVPNVQKLVQRPAKQANKMSHCVPSVQNASRLPQLSQVSHRPETES